MGRVKRAVAIPRKHQPTREQRDFIIRRVSPLLTGCGPYELNHLLAEAYLQGMLDAAQVLHPKDES